MLYLVACLGLLVVAWAMVAYNSLVRARNRVEESWSGIDVQLERRLDLVPNLVETVTGYARHERETIAAATGARSAAAAAHARAERARLETALSDTLGQIKTVAERYPELRASESFKRLQAQLTEVEDDIQAARRIYNSNVAIYNTRVQSFPTSMIARPAGFEFCGYFGMEVSAERPAPEVAVA